MEGNSAHGVIPSATPTSISTALTVTEIAEEDWLWEREDEKEMIFGVFLVFHQNLGQTTREAV